MKYLLDTNVCIQILKGKSTSIKSRIASISNDRIVIPSIVRFEIFYGSYKSDNPEKTLGVLKEFLSVFDTAEFNNKSAQVCGKIRATLEQKGKPIGPYDLMIAAIAISNDYILVSNNTREFTRIENINLEDWQ